VFSDCAYCTFSFLSPLFFFFFSSLLIQEEKPSQESTSITTTEEDHSFKLLLVDLQSVLIEELKKSFAGLPNVEFYNSRFEQLPEYDCIVSAANSFGLMDGGVDAAITVYFGDQLQKRVQQRILEDFEGEQPVGTSFIISTKNSKHPWCAHTPTMRVPMSVEGTDHVYLAMKAMLNAVKKHNSSTEPGDRIKSVACTGLGTFYGKLALDEAARQMALAYKNFLFPPKKINWHFATERQHQVVYGGFDGFRLALALRTKKAAASAQSRAAVASQMMDTAECNAQLGKTEDEDECGD